MDIQQASDSIAGALITKQKEIDALSLASSILSDKFSAEFTARDQALKELSETHGKLNTEKSATAQIISEKSALETAYNNALAEKDALISESVAKDKTIEDLQAQVDAMKPVDVPV